MHPIRSHDALFRFVFGDAETMAELLRAQLPGEVAAAIDWASLRPADRDFVDEVLQERRSDLLFEVDLHGRPALLHVLCDHKSDDERFTALQLVRYTHVPAPVPAAQRLPADRPGRDGRGRDRRHAPVRRRRADASLPAVPAAQ